MRNGKGSKPRNCFSKEFKNNFDKINWTSKGNSVESTITIDDVCGEPLGSFQKFLKNQREELKKQKEIELARIKEFRKNK